MTESYSVINGALLEGHSMHRSCPHPACAPHTQPSSSCRRQTLQMTENQHNSAWLVSLMSSKKKKFKLGHLAPGLKSSSSPPFTCPRWPWQFPQEPHRQEERRWVPGENGGWESSTSRPKHSIFNNMIRCNF